MTTQEATSEADRLLLNGGRALAGTVAMPGDKSVTLRALLMAAMADGVSVVRNPSYGHDARSLVEALQQLGVEVARTADGLQVAGGYRRLVQPDAPVLLGDSPTALRLLTGMLAGSGREVTLELDQQSELRLDPLVDTLHQVRVRAVARHRDSRPSIVVHGGRPHAGDVRPAAVSAQLKSVLLLSGVQAEGRTRVTEERPTRNHTEELLPIFGAEVEIEDQVTTVVHGTELSPADFAVPGDPSHAAYWLVAGAIVSGSSIVVEGIHTGRRRAAYLDVLRAMGADIEVYEAAGAARAINGPTLRPVDIHVDKNPALLDEVPVLALAAGRAAGVTTISGVDRVRQGPANRVAATIALLRSLGVDVRGDDAAFTVTGRPDGFVVPDTLPWQGDHHLGLAATIAAISASGDAVVPHISRAVAAYPEFVDHLEVLAS